MLDAAAFLTSGWALDLTPRRPRTTSDGGKSQLDRLRGVGDLPRRDDVDWVPPVQKYHHREGSFSSGKDLAVVGGGVLPGGDGYWRDGHHRRGRGGVRARDGGGELRVDRLRARNDRGSLYFYTSVLAGGCLHDP